MDNSAESIDNTPAFQLKGSLFTLTILQLINPNPELFAKQLTSTIEKAPKFFQHAPIVIDLQNLAHTQYRIDFSALNKLLRDNQLIPIAICGGNQIQQQAAIDAGLAILTAKHAPAAMVPEDTAKAATTTKKKDKKEKPVTMNPARMIAQPVRSGQQIYAKDSDLIVLSSVSHGAELLADGNIHVYGTLRGRALAGINGNKEARIFCKTLDAELVSIAGLYQLNDDFANKTSASHIQIYLQDERLNIEAI